MAHNRINLGGDGVTYNGIVAAPTLPGSLCQVDATGNIAAFAVAGGGEGVSLYWLDRQNVDGKKAGDLVTTDSTASAYHNDEKCLFAVRVDASLALVEGRTPLAQGATAGQLRIGVPGTDHIVAYANETIAVTEASQLVAVRGAK